MTGLHDVARNELVTIDIRLIQWIESVLCLDDAPTREVVEALHERVQACRAEHRDPKLELELVEDRHKALSGGWLKLYELRPIQQLRGWHRVRYGNVVVHRDLLTEVARVLDLLTLALGNECDSTLEEYSLHHVGEPPQHPVPDQYWTQYACERAAVLKSMAEYGECGECTWCQVIRLRDQCEAALSGAKKD